jgi:predicted small lipoprotein YifL
MKKASQLCGILALVLAPVLVGCGQKGPLYLPQPVKPSADAAKTAPAPAPKPVPEASGK